ncbi:ATP-binding protein [Streptomyces chrestomyceticus]|uniref:ATP-binding protein n=1 Tax=Streptomyces chrestomyceticus TaxID=68185 RepID=UPI0037AB0C68
MTSLSEREHSSTANRAIYSQTVPCEPSTAEAGRQLVQSVLGLWQLDSLADSATLIVTELIANAARHTSCQEIRLTVGWPSAARVRIGVLDREPSRLPVCGRAEDDAESGRGLVLIDAVADRWSYDLCGSGRCPWGKEVWAELSAKGEQ